jgi:LCP family protein required for cell wall assembly
MGTERDNNMKVYGSRGGKHKGTRSRPAQGNEVRRRTPEEQAEIERMIAKYQRRKKAKRVFTGIVIILILAAALLVFWKLYVKPPEVVNTKRGDTTSTDDTAETPAAPEARTGEKYTFVVLGTDDGNGNTDTIMVATFDTTDYTLDVLSVPRDTLVNVEWAVKKANTLYAYGGPEGVVSGLADILGYEVDFYVVVDLDAFVILVDAIGGVYYDVPVDMYYEDPYQDLYIDLEAGYQYLTGEQAVGVVRFRSGYENADIGRIGTQQDFMKTVCEQILANKDSIKTTDVINVFLNYVDTDLTYGNLIWLAQEFFKVDAENIHFYTLPGNYGDSIYQGGDWISYVTINVDELLPLINEYLNPFDEDIVKEDLNILTRDEYGNLYSTSGYYAGDSDWGNYSPDEDW